MRASCHCFMKECAFVSSSVWNAGKAEAMNRHRSRSPVPAPWGAAHGMHAARRWAAQNPVHRARTSLACASGAAAQDASVEVPGGFSALRPDGPVRLPRAVGRLPNLGTEQARQEALDNLEQDIYAASSSRGVQARLRTIARILAPWGLQPHPITVQKVLCAAAGLKAGHYRSSANFLSAWKVQAERVGEILSPGTLRAISDGVRSCNRGQGPPLRSAALPFERLGALPGGRDPWVQGGPMSPRNAMVLGSWWLAREAELAGTRAVLVSFSAAPVLTVEWVLPASKTDIEAHGVARAHACVCVGGSPRPDCPAHAALDQRLFLERAFPSRHRAGHPDQDLPLFPDREGRPVSKMAFSATILHAAAHLGVPAVSQDGTRRITGHSLRPTGAQGLTRLGLDVWAVQLLGRWGSATVQAYIRDATVSAAAASARRQMLGKNLITMVQDVAEEATGASPCKEGLEKLVANIVRRQLSCLPGPQRPSQAQELADAVRVAVESATPFVTPSLSSSSSSSSDESGSELEPPIEDAAVQAPIVPWQGVTLMEVEHSKTHVVHRVVAGPPRVACDSWLTACGWRFGRTQLACFPTLGASRCRNCWPAADRSERGHTFSGHTLRTFQPLMARMH